MRDQVSLPHTPRVDLNIIMSYTRLMRKKQTKSERYRLALAKHEKWLKSMGAHPTQRTAKADRRSVAQPGSASGLGPEGQKFESSHSDHPPSFAPCPKKPPNVYTGARKLLGIACMHKSNLVPVFEKKDLVEIGKMRR